MKFGLTTFPTDLSIQPVSFARAAEAAGFESIWFPEHSHIPASRATPWGGVQGAPPLPEHYRRTHDAIVALAAAAASTSTIRLGTGITLLAQRDPIWTAKEIASLDVISGGRVTFGVGYGWNIEEMENHAVATRQRRAIVREKLLAMREIWTNDEATFEGEHVAFDSIWSWPKPIQQPHPPVFIGGAPTQTTFQHVAEFAQGWMPIYGRFPIVERISDLHTVLHAAGRSPDTVEITVFQAPDQPELIAELREQGVDRVLFGVPSVGEAEALARIDELAATREAVS